MVANILLFNPKGMAAKGAGATAERSDRHRPHRGKVVATYIGRRVNHYRFALRTSSGLHPFHYWFALRTSSGLHPALRKLAFYAPLCSAVLPAERANFDSELLPTLATS